MRTDLRIKPDVNKMNRKIVILLGAGSTYSDADNVPDYEKPPLNPKFFANTRTSIEQSTSDSTERNNLLENIRRYFERKHGIDIFLDTNDFLENIMSKIFLDLKEPASKKDAYPIFRNLLTLLHERIGETTNNMTINKTKSLYCITNFYIRNGIIPENLTIISFNYDIYIEKTLAVLARSFFDPDQTIFLLQHCYELDVDLPTRPPFPREGYFPIYLGIKKGGIRVLKLHGSLNWYSYYPVEEIDLEDMFNPDRPMKISGEKEINSTKLRYRNSEGLIRYTLPVIVPPVPNKAEIYHSKILNLWSYANDALIDADELLIFGYSCPSSDTESKNLLRTTLELNKKIQKISIIDTDLTIINRYQELMPSKDFCQYSDAIQFLESKYSDVKNERLKYLHL
jgi:hypothetical protein